MVHPERANRGLAHRMVLCVAVTVLAAAASGCVSMPMGGLAGMGENPSLYGSYLAARQAGKTNDMRSAARYYSRALAHQPNDQSILERAFLLDLSAGNMDKAVGLARRIIRIRDDDRLARLVLTVHAIRSGAFSTARDNVAASAKGPLTDMVNLQLTSWSLAGEGHTELAVAALSGLDRNPGLDLYKAFHSALIYDLGGYETLAEAEYDRALELSDGGSLRIVEAYGRFLERDGRSRQAVQLYQDYLDTVANHPLIAASLYRARTGGEKPARLIPTPQAGAAEAIYGLSGALARERDRRGPDLPIVYLHMALYLHEDFAIAQSLMAELLENAGRTEDAIAIYREVDRTSPLWANSRIRTAYGLSRLDRKDEGIEMLEGVIKMAPDNKDVLASIADLLQASEHYAAAAEYYARAIAQIDAVEPRHWSLFFQHGASLERSKRWDEAEVSLKKALELQPDQPFVLNYLGYSWIDQGRNLDEAMEMIQKAAALEPENGFIIDSLGWGYYRLGDYEKAVETLERAIELAPGDPTINDHLGDAYWQVGRRLEARFQWSHALTHDPDPDVAARAERKLQVGLSEGDATLSDAPSVSVATEAQP